jgi:hypothetical protein
MENNFSSIYKYYEKIREDTAKNGKGLDVVTYVYKCKSKQSSIIAEELRKFGIKLCQHCATRWNTYLFVTKSVLKLSQEQYKEVRESMRKSTPKEQAARAAFGLTLVEREMLTELKDVLEMFQFCQLELQSNKVSISRVYPCIQYLKMGLKSNLNDAKYTQQLRRNLINSIETRFDDLIESDLCLISTVLDPNFGIDAFEPDKKSIVKSRLKKLLQKMTVSTESTFNNHLKNNRPVVQQRKPNYIFHTESSVSCSLIPRFDELDSKIEEFFNIVKSADDIDPLIWWKANESRFLTIADLAKKYLGVQASSAGPERMFSISGHIFAEKRRRLGVRVFSDLVVLKLNEAHLNKCQF